MVNFLLGKQSSFTKYHVFCACGIVEGLDFAGGIGALQRKERYQRPYGGQR